MVRCQQMNNSKASLSWTNENLYNRIFQYRTHLFFNNVLLTSLSPLGNMIAYFYRVEFQNRGSPHLHGLFYIQNSPIYEEAFLEEVTKFIDKFITCAKETNSTADIATNS